MLGEGVGECEPDGGSWKKRRSKSAELRHCRRIVLQMITRRHRQGTACSATFKPNLNEGLPKWIGFRRMIKRR